VSHDPEEARLRALLCAHPDGAPIAEAQLTPIGSGMINRCWRADTRHGPRFVRLGGRVAHRLGADWVSELALLELASGNGLAPRPVLAVPAAGLLVTELIVARRDVGVGDPEWLERAGRLMHAVHTLPPAPGIRRLDFAAQARALELELGPATGADASLRVAAAASFARVTVRPVDAVPCHNDVHASNLIDDGRRLRLVDWEYGGLGDPLFDVAGFVSHHALDDAAIGTLLSGYGAPVDRTGLRDACWGYDYVQWLWHRVVAGLEGSRGAASAAAANSLGRSLAARV
jgi:hypothetical protein